MRLGFLGAGRVATRLAQALNEDGHDIVFALSRAASGMANLDKTRGVTRLEGLDEVDLVVEAASPDALARYGPEVLRHCDLAIVSTTALADPDLQGEFDRVQAENGTKLTVTPGGIVGLDTLGYVRDCLESVRIETVKPPAMWQMERHANRQIIFSGTTAEACRRHPRNVNVHASVALASIGFERCRSTLVSDPDAREATQHVTVEGPDFGWSVTLRSRPIGGVTGSLTPQSMLGAVRSLISDRERGRRG